MTRPSAERAGGGNTSSLIRASVALFCAVLCLSACQSAPQRNAGAQPSGKSAALVTMERVAIAAHRCWFASGDDAFRSYSFANELNSFSGQPRFLLVPRNNYGGRPLLVVQAQGNPPRLETFGPLMQEPLGARIAADVARWNSGSGDCASGA